MILKQSTAYVASFLMVDSTDHVTGKVSLTPTVQLSKAGGNWGNAAGAVAEISGAGNGVGQYKCSLTTGDTDTVGELWLKATSAGADDTIRYIGYVQAVAVGELVTDAVTAAVIATGAIDADAIADGAIDAGAIANGAIDAATFAAGAIDAAAIATGAIDADAIAASAIGASELAADAVAEIADGVWDEVITAAQHNVKNSAAVKLRQSSGGTQVTLHSGTAQSGAAGSIQLDTGASATNDIYNGNLIVLTGGTGMGQTRRIVDYVGSTKTATVDKAWAVNPDATTTFDVIAAPSSVFSQEGTAQDGAASSITLSTDASAIDDTYNGALVTILSGPGAGETKVITDYNGTSKVASIAAETWSVQPTSASVYAVIPAGNYAPDTGGVFPSASEVSAAVWGEALASGAASGSAAEALRKTFRVTVGKWHFDKVASTLTLYDSDGVTVLYTLNIVNSATVSSRTPA